MADNVIHIDYYSDLLCVWAWIAQPRLDELHSRWQEQIVVRHRFVDVFGDAHRKIPTQWGKDGDGFEKFAQHVHHSAEPFEHTQLSDALWRDCKPRSSASAHIALRAAAIAHDDSVVAAYALALRKAFFCQARDISDMDVLMDIAAATSLNTADLRRAIENGTAHAALMSDLRDAQAARVSGSPTFVLNNGRQILYGNVGYRILHANIEEVLRQPADEASWC